MIGQNTSRIIKCLAAIDSKSAPAEVRPRIRIDTNGTVSQVEVRPPLQDAQAEDCLTKVLRAMRFRKHTNKNMAPVTIPLTLKRG